MDKPHSLRARKVPAWTRLTLSRHIPAEAFVDHVAAEFDPVCSPTLARQHAFGVDNNATHAIEVTDKQTAFAVAHLKEHK
jgi:hypothetical protein